MNCWNYESSAWLSCVTRRCWTRKFKERDDNRKKCLKALLFSFRFVLVLFFWAAGHQVNACSCCYGFHWDFFSCYECVNGVFKEGLNHVRSRKTEPHTSSRFKHDGGKKRLVLVLYWSDLFDRFSVGTVYWYIWLFTSLIWIWDLFFLSRNVVVVISFRSYLGSF